jgi:tetratricopeptide (TPR) repeat protein
MQTGASWMQLEFISDRRNTMITKLALTILLAIPSVAAAQGKLADQLRKAIVEEEANQKLDTAIEAYTKILAQYDEDRKVAATALFHLAECSRKLGQKEKAIAAYQRVLREFTDQAALANASRNNLAQAYGISTGREPVALSQREQDLQKLQLLEIENQEKELQLQLGIAEAQLQAAHNRVGAGLIAPIDLETIKLEIERIKMRLSEVALRKSILINQIKK